MNILFGVLVGIHIISLIIMESILYEYRVVNKGRRKIYVHLEHKEEVSGRFQENRLLAGLYLFSTIFFTLMFTSIFLLPVS